MTDTYRGFGAALAALAMLLMAAGPTWAEERKGQVTQLPIPRFVSLKASEGNVRRGPSLSHRIDWVYRRRDLPLQIVNEFGHWRQVRDHDGAGGWVHYSLLSGVRTAMVEAERLNLMARPDPDSGVVAIVERGVVARLSECEADWCRLRIDGHRGWARKSALWGVAQGESWN